MATIGIDFTALSTPEGDGIGTPLLQTMREPLEHDAPHRSLTFALPPVDVLWRVRPPDSSCAPSTRRVAAKQAEPRP